MFCSACIHRHLCRCITCPMCRRIVTEIEPSPKHTTTLPLQGAVHAGITVKNSDGGVVVLRLCRGDVAERYLERGDVITHVNGVPVLRHEDAVDLIDELTRIGKNARLTVVRPKSLLPLFSYRSFAKLSKWMYKQKVTRDTSV
jgi:C-terminal processing protease CtpA/Prc